MSVKLPPGVGSATGMPSRRRRGRYANVKLNDKGQNRVEAAYDEWLAIRKAAGEIADYDFEAIKFKLADKTFYTPDFVIYEVDETLTFVDTKAPNKAGGYRSEDDSTVKIKCAAERFPFRFLYGWKPKNEDWKHKEW